MILLRRVVNSRPEFNREKLFRAGKNHSGLNIEKSNLRRKKRELAPYSDASVLYY